MSKSEVAEVLYDGLCVLSVPLGALLELHALLRQVVRARTSCHQLGQESIAVFLVECRGHGCHERLVGRNSNHCGEAESKVKSTFEVQLVTSLEPEEGEGVLAVRLRNCLDLLDVAVALSS